MIQKETGWTDDYMLWGISWANMQMKLADAPWYKYNRSEKGEQVIDSDEGLCDYLNKMMYDGTC